MQIDPDIIEPSIDPNTKKIAVRHVKATNASGTRTKIQVRDFKPIYSDEPDTLGGTNTAPSPLEMTLAALVGCDGVIIHGVATAMNFDYVGVDLRCESQIDVRGPKGVPGIRPYFEELSLEITIFTDESDERLLKLSKNVEFRCPVMNLFSAAGVEMNVSWIRKPAIEYVNNVD
ncbi:OsmC family protein [Litorivicinus sp.]|jgi:putative redox protein|nr:OsmC family protein [Litorivicinus sp.]MDC1207895.1 OsmC family protein [Litorivicinus sp.]MDC1240699.1 OsmC family protein [Litorivicinus sp.]|tara:strand:+ start:4064 stop:4585 length:522 start_codon:yes stop_codon:yes gene_type:complete